MTICFLERSYIAFWRGYSPRVLPVKQELVTAILQRKRVGERRDVGLEMDR